MNTPTEEHKNCGLSNETLDTLWDNFGSPKEVQGILESKIVKLTTSNDKIGWGLNLKTSDSRNH